MGGNSLLFDLLNARLDMGHISLGFIINSLKVLFANDGQASLSAQFTLTEPLEEISRLRLKGLQLLKENSWLC